MRILKVLNKPTRINITQNVVKNCRTLYGDDWAGLMLESVRSVERDYPAQKPEKNFVKKLINRLRPKKEFTINVISNENRDFFVTSNLKIGSYKFQSKKIQFDILETLDTLKNFRKRIQETRNDILAQITGFNNLRKGKDKNLLIK